MGVQHEKSKRSNEDLCVEWQRTGDPKIRDQLVKNNLDFVRKLATEAKEFRLFDDLVQEGAIGFLRAIDRWDASRNLKLLTYAGWWVRSYQKSFLLSMRRVVSFGTRVQRDSERQANYFSFDVPIEQQLIPELRVDAAIEEGTQEHEILGLAERFQETLEPRERDIFQSCVVDGKSCESVSERHGISRERVRQLKEQAFDDFREHVLARAL